MRRLDQDRDEQVSFADFCANMQPYFQFEESINVKSCDSRVAGSKSLTNIKIDNYKEMQS